MNGANCGAAPVCSGSSTSSYACNNGACVGINTPCIGNYSCAPNGGCNSVCLSDSDCAGGNFICVSNGQCILNSCTGQQDGTNCLSDIGTCATSASCKNNRCTPVFPTCPGSNCNGKGTCCNGLCLCSFGYSGSDCATGPFEITLQNAVSSIIDDFFGTTFKFYTFNLPVDVSLLNFTLAITGPGAADLYVKKNTVASLSTYDYSSYTDIILIPNAVSAQYYVTVQQTVAPASFTLWVTIPDDTVLNPSSHYLFDLPFDITNPKIYGSIIGGFLGLSAIIVCTCFLYRYNEKKYNERKYNNRKHRDRNHMDRAYDVDRY